MNRSTEHFEFILNIFAALTEILDDDVEDEIEMNAAISDTRQYDTIKPQHIAVATQKRKVDTERIKYVYVMNNKKLASIDKTDPMDYYGPTEIDEEDVELIVANDQNKIDLVDGEPLLEQLDDIEEEIAVPTKRRRSDDGREIAKSPAPVTQPDESSRVTQPTINHQPEDDSKTIATNRDEEVIEGPRSRANPIDSNDEETLFALSLVGTLKRLPPPKLAAAKCHILTYLMQLEYGDASTKFSWSPFGMNSIRMCKYFSFYIVSQNKLTEKRRVYHFHRARIQSHSEQRTESDQSVTRFSQNHNFKTMACYCFLNIKR